MKINKISIKAFDIAKNPKYDEYQRALPLIVYTFFDKKTTSATLKLKTYPTNN